MVPSAHAAATPVPRKVKILVDTWAKRLGLSQTWHIDVKCVPGLRANDQTPCKATANWQPGYTHGTISFASDLIPTWSDSLLENIVIHELLHLRMAPFDDGIKNQSKKMQGLIEEHVDQMASIIRRAYSRKKRIV